MKKILYVLVFIGLIWLVKLSYDTYTLSGQLSAVQDELHKSEQTIANLNDQLVATQRQSSNALPTDLPQTSQTPNMPAQVVGLNPTLLLKQKVELVQFALQQQQFVYAVEQLNQLDVDIEHYDLADTLRQGLHQAVIKDKQMIQQYVAARTAQLAQLNEVLQQVDQRLLIQNNTLSVATSEQAHFWETWFKVDRVDQADSHLINRKLILKEVQLRVLLAQQALMRGDFVAYQSMLNLIDTELQHLPDQYSQKIQRTILKVKQKQLNPIPKLSTSAILE